MPTLSYTATGFPDGSPSGLSGTHDLTFSWSELVWAAITVGRAGISHVLQFGLFSAYEIVYRAALVYANIMETAGGGLFRSAAYDGLDPSEKGAVSYFLGLTLSKLFAERCLQVPWLLHLDIYRAQLSVILGSGRSKPDLVGQDSNGDWVVIESKGRTHGLDEAALAKAKTQSERVRSISGVGPKYRMGVQSYFESSRLCLSIDDPDGDGEIDLPITREMVEHEYYRPFRGWLDDSDHVETIVIGNRIYIVRREPRFDLAVGLDVGRYRRQPIEKMSIGAAENLLGLSDRFVGKDGVLVFLGTRWSSERMREQPEYRPTMG
jgi:hypothetical protein